MFRIIYCLAFLLALSSLAIGRSALAADAFTLPLAPADDWTATQTLEAASRMIESLPPRRRGDDPLLGSYYPYLEAYRDKSGGTITPQLVTSLLFWSKQSKNIEYGMLTWLCWEKNLPAIAVIKEREQVYSILEDHATSSALAMKATYMAVLCRMLFLDKEIFDLATTKTLSSQNNELSKEDIALLEKNIPARSERLINMISSSLVIEKPREEDTDIDKEDKDAPDFLMMQILVNARRREILSDSEFRFILMAVASQKFHARPVRERAVRLLLRNDPDGRNREALSAFVRENGDDLFVADIKKILRVSNP